MQRTHLSVRIILLCITIILTSLFSACSSDDRTSDEDRVALADQLRRIPEITLSGSDRLAPGETARYVISIAGMSSGDRVTRAPQVSVLHDGLERERFVFGEEASPIRDSIVIEDGAERTYYLFDWTPAAPGTYELWIQAGTDYIAWIPDPNGGADRVKVATREYSEEAVLAAIDSDPAFKGTPIQHFVEMSGNLDPVKHLVTVTAP